MNEETLQQRLDRIAAYEASVTKWGIYKYFEFWGWVELTGQGLVTGGPHPDYIDYMLEDMRQGRTDEELFRSLPKRLRGVVHVGPPDYDPADYPEFNAQ